MDERLLTVRQMANSLGIGMTSAYKLIKERKIKATKTGKNIVIPRKELDDYIEKLCSS